TYFLFYFHEELLESLYALQKNKTIEGLILGYFLPEYLLKIDELVDDLFEREEKKLADNDYLGFVIHIAITIQRVENQFQLEEEYELINGQSPRSFQLISQLCEKLSAGLSILLSKKDIYYLVAIMQGSKARDSEMAG